MVSHCDYELVVFLCILKLFENPLFAILAEARAAVGVRTEVIIVVKRKKTVAGSELNNVTHLLGIGCNSLARAEIIIHFPEIKPV